MHQTTIRFVPRVWEQLEQEARAQGVSSAQYVREATIARLAYDASARDGSADFLRYDGERAGAAMRAADEHRADSQAASRQADRRSTRPSPRQSHQANRERR